MLGCRVEIAAARVYPVWIFNAANQRHTAGVRVVDHAADIKPTIVQGNGQSVITKRRGLIDQIGRGVGDIVVGVGRRMRVQLRSSASARAWLLSIHIMSAMPKMPEWLVPMAATLTQERFSGWRLASSANSTAFLLAYKQGSKCGCFRAIDCRNVCPRLRPRSRSFRSTK